MWHGKIHGGGLFWGEEEHQTKLKLRMYRSAKVSCSMWVSPVPYLGVVPSATAPALPYYLGKQCKGKKAGEAKELVSKVTQNNAR
jgi:hypothetical protein